MLYVYKSTEHEELIPIENNLKKVHYIIIIITYVVVIFSHGLPIIENPSQSRPTTIQSRKRSRFILRKKLHNKR